MTQFDEVVHFLRVENKPDIGSLSEKLFPLVLDIVSCEDTNHIVDTFVDAARERMHQNLRELGPNPTNEAASVVLQEGFHDAMKNMLIQGVCMGSMLGRVGQFKQDPNVTDRTRPHHGHRQRK